MTGGTLFRLYPQYAAGYTEPECVAVSSPRGSLGAGPEDAAMYAIDPVHKAAPYEPFTTMPPYPGPCRAPAVPDRDGNFDQIAVEDPAFLAAHLFGCARRVLDVWEAYLGRRIVWWHAPALPRLELVAMVDWANAQSGPGFLETGLKASASGEPSPFCLNFDIVAHEIGHAILFSEVGVPAPPAIGRDFLAFHESVSDLVALVSALHFDSVVDRLLAQTDGNLYVLNLVSRIGETSDLDEIRIADNVVVMADVAVLWLGADGAWHDPTGKGRNAHHYAQPLTGAIFDTLVDLYQEGLVARGAVEPGLDVRQWTPEEAQASLAWVHGASARALERFGQAFREALQDARDCLGSALADMMTNLDADTVSFGRVAALLLEGLDRRGVPDLDALVENFLFRGIDPRACWSAPSMPSDAGWTRLPYSERHRRVAAAQRGNACCAAGRQPDDYALAGRLMPHAHRTRPGRHGPAL